MIKIISVTFYPKQILSVYPNPSNGNFTIETSDNLLQQMQISDATGALILSQQIQSKTVVDASNLKEGVYNIRIGSENNLVNKKMMIVK